MTLRCPNCKAEIFDWSAEIASAADGQTAQQANRLIALAREVIRLREPGASNINDQDWINLLRRAHDWMTQALPLQTQQIHIVHGTIDKAG